MRKIVAVIFVSIFMLTTVRCGLLNDELENTSNDPTPSVLLKNSPPRSPLPTITITPTNNPTLTPYLTATTTITPSPTLMPDDATRKARFEVQKQTQEYWMFTEVPATLEARDVNCKVGFALEQGLSIILESNNEWTLFTCSPVSEDWEKRWTPGIVDYSTRYTQVIKNDHSQIWTVQHSNYAGLLRYDRPDVLMSPYRWTADGDYVYLFPRSYPAQSGGSDSTYLETRISSLYRLNLETGEFELVLDGSQFKAFELSPNDRFLVYSENDEPDIIHLMDMETGDNQQVKLYENIYIAGSFIWNSDSTKIVFFAGYSEEGENQQGDLSGTSIFVLTPKYMHAQKILAKDSRFFVSYQCFDNHESYWIDENTMCLYSVGDDQASWNKIFSININSGELEFVRDFP